MTRYTGFVAGVRDGVAYAVLRDEQGLEFDVELPANADLRERRRFTLVCETVPDAALTPEHESRIRDQVEAALGPDDAADA